MFKFWRPVNYEKSWLEADNLIAEGERAKADRIYVQLAKAKKTTAIHYYYSALAFYRLGQSKSALELLHRGRQRFPGTDYLLEQYARISLEARECNDLFTEVLKEQDPHRAANGLLRHFENSPYELPFIEACIVEGFWQAVDLHIKEKFLQPNHVHAATLWAIGDMLEARKCHVHVQKIYRHFVDRELNDATDHLYAGLSAYRLGDPKNACRILRRACESYPSDLVLWQHLINICINEGRFGDLLFEDLSTKDEERFFRFSFRVVESTAAEVQLLDLCMSRGLTQLVEEKFSLFSISWSDAAKLWQLSDVCIKHQKISYAQTIQNKLMDTVPLNEDDFLYAALAACRLGKFDRGLDVFKRGVAKYGDDGPLYEHYVRTACERNLVDHLFGEGEKKNFEKLFGRLFAKYKYSLVQINLIDACLKIGCTSLAQHQMSHLLALENNSAQLWALADLHESSSRKAHAIEIYRYLSTREGGSQDHVIKSILSACRLGDVDLALCKLRKAMDIYPADKSIADLYERTCMENGRLEVLFYNSAESQDVDPRKIFDRYVGSVYEVDILDYFLSGSYRDLALDVCRRFLQEWANAGKLWQLVRVLNKHALRGEAKLACEKIVNLAPENLDDFSVIALAYNHLGRVEETLDTLERGADLFGGSPTLEKLYVEICALNFKYQRFSGREVSRVDDSACIDVSPYNLYRAALDVGCLDGFIYNFNLIEYYVEAEDFLRLKNSAWDLVRDAPLSFERARTIIFFIKYLDIDPDYAQGLIGRIIGYCVFSAAGVDAERFCLDMTRKLALPFLTNRLESPQEILSKFTEDCQELSACTLTLRDPFADMTANWFVWQSIFCLGAPHIYSSAISALESLAKRVWPQLKYRAPHVQNESAVWKPPNKRIRIGFIVHDSMPMMSGLIPMLDSQIIESIYLRPGEAGVSEAAKGWRDRAEKVVEYSDNCVEEAIATIAAEELDIVISGPSLGSIFFPMMARLAKLQIILLEPNWTDGFLNADYYVSWRPAEPKNYSNFYRSSVALFESPPYWIEEHKNANDGAGLVQSGVGVRERLLKIKSHCRVYLCAQTPPKIQPAMDDVFYKILDRDKDAYLVFLRSDFMPAQNLRLRLLRRLGHYFSRVILLPSLTKADAHELLLSADCCIDSFPITGMSSSFDSAILGVPMVTMASDIPFGRWTSSIYEYIGVSGLVARNGDEYVEIAVKLARDKDWRSKISEELKLKSRVFVESTQSASEFQNFIVDAWTRAMSGCAPADWIAGRWETRPESVEANFAI